MSLKKGCQINYSSKSKRIICRIEFKNSSESNNLNLKAIEIRQAF